MASSTLIHVTHRKNVPSILAYGLDPARATGRGKAVWLASPLCLQWAVSHCCDRHDWTPADLVVVVYRGRRQPTRRWAFGLWYSLNVIPPKVLSVHSLEECGWTDGDYSTVDASRPEAIAALPR